MSFTRCTVREEDVEDAMDVLLPLLPLGVHERPVGEGRVELSWRGERPLAAELGEMAGGWETGAPAPAPSPVVVAGRPIVLEAAHGSFGTGAHPTTRDSLELLAALEPDGAFADLGCGAGLLALAAARLGFAPVIAVDVEHGAIAATAANAQANELAVEARQADLIDAPPPPAPTLAANVPLAVHLAMAPRVGETVGRVIVSGIVLGEADAAIAAYAGFRVAARRDSEGWTTLLLERA